MGLSWDTILHCNRHTALTDLGAAGADAFTIQAVAGHASVTTSERYVDPVPETIARAIARLDEYRKTEAESRSKQICTGVPLHFPLHPTILAWRTLLTDRKQRRESGGIGRRTRLRIWRVKPWGFESPLSHQQLAAHRVFARSPLCPILYPPGIRVPQSIPSLEARQVARKLAQSRPPAGECTVG